ncbi:probable serine/threonine-protein kinase kinX isoform X2 [Phaenicophaeus curvirostris]|uniref:probable serine/threonine-protein kinase kinX isoform X2 n=1 Tax=Phaenicophaeus curvirostris TaxID=33595 RepID=UPI0037F097AC
MPLIQGSALSTCSQRLRPHRLMKACKKRMLILKKAGSTAAQPNTRSAMEPTRCLKRIRNTVPASRVVMESKRSILQLKALLHEFWLFNVMLETAKVAASNMGWRKELDEEEPMEIDEKVIVDVEMEEDTEEPMDIDEKIIVDVEMEEDTDEPEDIDEKIIMDVEIEEDMEEPMDVDEKIIVDVEMEEDTDELEDIDEKIIEDVEMEEDTEEAMDVDEKIIVDVEMEEDTEEPMDIDEKIIMDVEMEDMEEAMDIDDKIIVDVELEEEEEEMWINPPSPGQARRGVGCGGKWMRGRQIKDTIRMTTMWPKTTMRTR